MGNVIMEVAVYFVSGGVPERYDLITLLLVRAEVLDDFLPVENEFGCFQTYKKNYKIIISGQRKCERMTE